MPEIRNKNFNNLVQPLLTDKYQLSMCYGFWRNNKHEDIAVFDVYFRKNPFKGEYTIFAGLDEVIKYIRSFRFQPHDIEYLKSLSDYANIEKEFWTYVESLTGESIRLDAMREGSVCFPNCPLIKLKGPLGLIQIIETTVLNLVNYASLVATNASRYRIAARSGLNKSCKMFELGLRRAQGPDGGLSASRYSYIGGFDATSNLLAGRLFGIPVCGTLGHSFIMSFYGTKGINKTNLEDHKFMLNLTVNDNQNFTLKCLEIRDDLKTRTIPGWSPFNGADQSELGAFISYAWSFPENFLALVDTYDVIKSGIVNFVIVAIALIEFGYRPRGIRIDSGDLAYLSDKAKNLFTTIATTYNLDIFNDLDIIASNDINEDTLICLNQQQNSITGYGIGTNLVTCQNQPALGCVYKLVEINRIPRMKLSSTSDKVNIPCEKSVYRLYSKDGNALIDILCITDEPPPTVGERILCRHPFLPEKRCYVTPSRVEALLVNWYSGGMTAETPNLQQMRIQCEKSLEYITQDIKRTLNPTPYKVAVSEKLYELLNNLRLSLIPIGDLS